MVTRRILQLHGRPLADLLGRPEGSRRTAAAKKEDLTVADSLSDLVEELVLANRILSHEGVLDAFGHVSVRHPRDPTRYLMSRSRSPLLVEPDDILEFTLDSAPVKPAKVNLYAERVIHGCIYQARSDVMAVCHHHAPAVLPFCIAEKPIVPVFHIGATIGDEIPFWDQHDEFGETNLLVAKAEEGHSLARALGPHAVVLMKRHGATVVGGGLKELVSRSIFLCWNAQYQLHAHALGAVAPLHRGEIALAGKVNTMPLVVARIWEYWSMRLIASGGWPPARAAAKAAPRARAKPARAIPRVGKTKKRR